MITTQSKKYLILIVWMVSIIFFLTVSLLSLNNSFIVHNYRQAQTALTAQYFSFNGLQWNFQTPFMGYPWRVPMEFPLYQVFVYLVEKFSGLNLVVCGKLINLLCHIVNNLLLIAIVNTLNLNKNPFFLGLIFYNLFPFYLVFDTVFLPDSLALTFVFLSFFYLIKFFKDKGFVMNFLAFLLFAALAGLSKSTTFISVLGPLIFILWLYHLKCNNYLFLASLKSPKILLSAFAFLIALTVSYLWIQYSDTVKSLNPFAANWISYNADFRRWNYGTLIQRLNIGNWTRYYSYSMLFHPLFVILNTILIILFLSISRPIEKKLSGALLLLFLLPPFFFFNLFWVHTYYSIANMFFYMLLLGVMIWALISNKNILIRYFGVLIFSFMLVFGLYRSWGFRNQIFKDGAEPGVYAKLNFVHFKPNYQDVIIVISQSRDPFLEYYFACKGINITTEEFKKYITKSTLENFTAGAPVEMICLVDSKALKELPSQYSTYLPAFKNQISISNEPESDEYFNFFWNNK